MYSAPTAASTMFPGVSKSGSPISRWTICLPWRSNARARTRTSNALSVPSRDIRLARCSFAGAETVTVLMQSSSVQPGSEHAAVKSQFTFCDRANPSAVTRTPDHCDAAHGKSRRRYRAKGGGTYSLYSISNSSLAVLSSMADTEQYFSVDRRTASSMALCDTLPRTRYTSLIWVNTLGCSAARSACATTSSPVNGSRFLRKIPTTSLAVHPHSPISTNSIGVLAVFTSPVSSTTAWPLLASPRKRSLSVQMVFASVMAFASCLGIADDLTAAWFRSGALLAGWTACPAVCHTLTAGPLGASAGSQSSFLAG